MSKGSIGSVSPEFQVAPPAERDVRALIAAGGYGYLDHDIPFLDTALALALREASFPRLFHLVKVKSNVLVRDAVSELRSNGFEPSGPAELIVFRASHPTVPSERGLHTINCALFTGHPILAHRILCVHYAPESEPQLIFLPQPTFFPGGVDLLVHRPVR